MKIKNLRCDQSVKSLIGGFLLSVMRKLIFFDLKTENTSTCYYDAV